jgi:hypothetical protein
MKDNPWIGVDFDGTLAVHEEGSGIEGLGKPVPAMVTRVKRWLREGKVVKIFTARVGNRDAKEVEEQTTKIKAWCAEHLGQELEVTATKDYNLEQIWDDRAVGIKRNTGVRTDGKP